MQVFGLLGLIITIALAAWWLTSPGPASVSEPANDRSSYQETIEAAEQAADYLGGAVGGQQVEVYDGISVPKNTRELDLSGRGLSGSLKAEIRHLENLEILNMSNNNFTGVPAEVGQLAKLRVLNLSSNPLTGLPYEIGNLSNLQTLDLRNTNYSQADLEIIKQQLPSDTIISVD